MIIFVGKLFLMLLISFLFSLLFVAILGLIKNRTHDIETKLKFQNRIDKTFEMFFIDLLVVILFIMFVAVLEYGDFPIETNKFANLIIKISLLKIVLIGPIGINVFKLFFLLFVRKYF